MGSRSACLKSTKSRLRNTNSLRTRQDLRSTAAVDRRSAGRPSISSACTFFKCLLQRKFGRPSFYVDSSVKSPCIKIFIDQTGPDVNSAVFVPYSTTNEKKKCEENGGDEWGDTLHTPGSARAWHFYDDVSRRFTPQCILTANLRDAGGANKMIQFLTKCACVTLSFLKRQRALKNRGHFDTCNT